MTTFNDLLNEAATMATAEELALSEGLDDAGTNLLEGLDEALFEGAEEDFQPHFDPEIDKLQFFNNSYVGLSNDELESQYNPDVAFDLNNREDNTDPNNLGDELHENAEEEFATDMTHFGSMQHSIPEDEVLYEEEEDEFDIEDFSNEVENYNDGDDDDDTFYDDNLTEDSVGGNRFFI